MRLLLECTYVYDHPHVNSGIQRVVRNIVNNISNSPREIECIPVIFKNNNIYRVFQLKPQKRDGFLLTRLWLENYLRDFGQLYVKRNNYRLFKAFKNLRRLLFIWHKLIAFPMLAALLTTKKLASHFVDNSRAIPFTYSPDDILVLLDSSWHAEFFSVAEQLKRNGVKIVSVIYDLIPITHPQFCDAGLVRVFEKWIEWVAKTADGFIAISQTIRDEVYTSVQTAINKITLQNLWFDYFYLGSELDQISGKDEVRRSTAEIFNQQPVYLMVSTIEPRKNHAYLLDAFEILWAKNIKVRLCFIGRIGWKCDALVERVKYHPEYGKQLFMFNDLTDTELEFCYESTKALVFPSFVEGFGLPLVEAMQRGVPVMASDIPVFREIGNDFIAYFSLEDPASLANLIASFEETGQFPAAKQVSEWKWINWGDAADMLIEKVVLHSQRSILIDQRSQ